ncbi:prepilin-type N-terminal cleavage/methylation domain-containing protein [Anabaena sphaerica FACHB-251]|uniref:Prepilin-type N-terminal cleavage/methylation domain-containing protein n=1 Tax=Anabaena sphaerica FACHB-251 TaxID=2692883 RepID=A0A927A0Q5_9NOST|nr:type IV pilin-like G/H family protein [Anabaena sphaerica]MBD2293496.1 prepilin-type N-terminal cleavage/methylation domain-containing protein [Anabaena sphaerica FACHB-251]
MKVQYSTKLIPHLIKKNHDHGFTIIELLVVMIVIGILSAIALPSFVNCANKSKTSEVKTYVGSMNRGQQAYFLESEDSKFSNSVNQLGIGIREETNYYRYSTKASTNTAFSYGIAKIEYIENNWFDKKPVKSVVGGVFVVPASQQEEITTVSILCINDKPGNIIPPQPILKNGVPTCAMGTMEVK